MRIEPRIVEPLDQQRTGGDTGHQQVLVERHLLRLATGILCVCGREPVLETGRLGKHVLAEVALCQRHSPAACLVEYDSRKALVERPGYQSRLSEPRAAGNDSSGRIQGRIALYHVQATHQRPGPGTQGPRPFRRAGIRPEVEDAAVWQRAVLNVHVVGIGRHLSIAGGHECISPGKYHIYGKDRQKITALINSASGLRRAVAGYLESPAVIQPAVRDQHLRIGNYRMIAVEVQHYDGGDRALGLLRIKDQPVYPGAAAVFAESHPYLLAAGESCHGDTSLQRIQPDRAGSGNAAVHLFLEDIQYLVPPLPPVFSGLHLASVCELQRVLERVGANLALVSIVREAYLVALPDDV